MLTAILSGDKQCCKGYLLSWLIACVIILSSFSTPSSAALQVSGLMAGASHLSKEMADTEAMDACCDEANCKTDCEQAMFNLAGLFQTLAVVTVIRNNDFSSSSLGFLRQLNSPPLLPPPVLL